MEVATQITSAKQLNDLLTSKTIVIIDFFADSVAACQQIAPLYDTVAKSLAQHKNVAVVKVNTENNSDLAAQYQITTLPTFIVFRDGSQIEKVAGPDGPKLGNLLAKLKKELEGLGAKGGKASGSGSSGWRGAELPRGYIDVTDQLEVKICDAMNYNTEDGSIRALIDTEKPSALGNGRGNSNVKDWMESDTDEQLMLFLPFQSVLKLHTLQITSLPPQDDDDDVPMRPRQIKLFVNKPHILGFDEAENMTATQVVELSEKDWNKDGTASIPLRYVKFQNITSLVIFVVDGDGDSEKVRIDRIRLIGESGPTRELGKLEKVGDEHGL